MDPDVPNRVGDSPTEPAGLDRTYAEHLRMLSVGHYVLGSVMAVFSLLPVLHVAMGAAIVSGTFAPPSPASGPAVLFPRAVGWMFIVLGSTCIATGLTLGIGVVWAGRYLAQRRRWWFCAIVSALACLFMPLGTLLGVLTLVTITRP